MAAPMSAAEQARFDRPPEVLLRRLQPFDFARHHKVKAAHVRQFSSVAQTHNLTLLLRATNPASLRYMEKTGYTAKPIDCKAKTADKDSTQGTAMIDCAGLVAAPAVVGRQAFGDRLQRALDSWRSFEASMHQRRLASGVVIYERADAKGFYAIDTSPPDAHRRHHGCLLLSEQAAPEDFDPRKSHSRQWMALHMQYVHGDYDLYGVIDNEQAAAAGNDKLHHEAVRKMQLLGQPHYVSSQSLRVVDLLNERFGADLVKHGEQSAYEFSADDVYLFFPSGDIRVVLERDFKQPAREMPGWFEDLYRYVFKTAYLGRDRVSARALR